MRTMKRFVKAGLRPIYALVKLLCLPVGQRLRAYFGRELEQQIRALEDQVKNYRDEVKTAICEIERLVLAFVASSPAGREEPAEVAPMRSAG